MGLPSFVRGTRRSMPEECFVWERSWYKDSRSEGEEEGSQKD